MRLNQPCAILLNSVHFNSLGSMLCVPAHVVAELCHQVLLAAFLWHERVVLSISLAVTGIV